MIGELSVRYLTTTSVEIGILFPGIEKRGASVFEIILISSDQGEVTVFLDDLRPTSDSLVDEFAEIVFCFFQLPHAIHRHDSFLLLIADLRHHQGFHVPRATAGMKFSIPFGSNAIVRSSSALL